MHFTYSAYGKDHVEIQNESFLSRLEAKEGTDDFFELSIKNKDDKDLFVNLCIKGNPLIDSAMDIDHNINMKIAYKDLEGNRIDPSRIEQGSDFIAEVKLSTTALYSSYRDLSLTQIFPSGWEIINKRMYGMPDALNESLFEYRDIRDDRVMTYFSLYRSGTVKYTVLLNAAYVGRFYLPGPLCEAMYNPDVYARRSGQWIEVLKPQ